MFKHVRHQKLPIRGPQCSLPNGPTFTICVGYCIFLVLIGNKALPSIQRLASIGAFKDICKVGVFVEGIELLQCRDVD